MNTSFTDQSELRIPSNINILSALKLGKKFSRSKPPGSSDSWLLADLAEQRKTPDPLVIFTDNPSDAKRFFNEISVLSPNLHVHQLPDWETLPYDNFSPHKNLIAKRLYTLYTLIHKKIDILIISVYCALQRIAPPEFLNKYTFHFKEGDYLDKSALMNQFISANYINVTKVLNPGEFCFRGGLIDLFPVGAILPCRLDLFDDEIESIHTFDISSQRSLKRITELRLLPSNEFPMDKKSRNLFCEHFRTEFNVDSVVHSKICQKVNNGIIFNGIEYYFPLFFEKTSTIFDYLSDGSICVTIGNIDIAAQNYLNNIVNKRFMFIKHDQERPALDPKKLFLDNEELFNCFKKFSRLILSTQKECADFSTIPDVSILQKNKDPIFNLRKILEIDKKRVLICADSLGRLKIITKMLNNYKLMPELKFNSFKDFLISKTNFAILVAPLNSGFYIREHRLLIVTENDLYPLNVQLEKYDKNHGELTLGNNNSNNFDLIFKDLSELRIGDPIVHKQHGVGRYHGLVNMDLENVNTEFLHLEYADNAILYVPITQINTISRYSNSNSIDSVPLHRLGSDQWDKAYRKAEKRIYDIAAELLKLYADRASRKGYSFKIPKEEYNIFSSRFNYQETQDQLKAIHDVINDMSSKKPMDRLICGDVGFGKTEVALRAAFLAVFNGKQVALFCPTTLLVEQHKKTFIDRFSDYPVEIAELSRFRENKEIIETLDKIKNGKIDIIIGTHKILSEKVNFKNLGLIIIDEEHRFGVQQKEKLKNNICKEVDVLTLTATPIPRTLNISLEGIRDLSIIATAPQKRLSVETLVKCEDRSSIQEALLREFRRGGQAYFLHNEIETIYARQSYLQKIIPEARLAIAHGQMKASDLEQVMRGFYQNRYNLLLCTTIIETGIDIPNANTIIIHRADRFGLAQLHQLRGRVGRSYHQAYAYLMVPDINSITKNAKKRLDAINLMGKLGSGFELAIHDLEIRGTGDILGDSQSGNFQEIGSSLYNEMLNKAIKFIKNPRKSNSIHKTIHTCDVNLHSSTLLPSDYCSDIPSRLIIYKRLSNINNDKDLFIIQEELRDRFGKLPQPVETLLAANKIRLVADSLNISKIDANEFRLIIHFMQDTKVSPTKIIQLLENNSNMKLLNQNQLHINIKSLNIKNRIQIVLETLQMFI
ncbi:MAG: transcription-repair coupling factor [Bordetella sp.]|nr:MAG: transcription-repair coupling factor [Bordetella sp.]